MLHPTLAARFGADLFDVFGPVADRRPASELTFAERQAIMVKIVETGGAYWLLTGPESSLLDVLIRAMTHAARHGYLKGIQFPNIDKLDKLTYPTMVNLEILYKDNRVQRGLKWDHVIDTMFKFDPEVFYAGVGRMTTDGKLVLNDAQHHISAGAILGISEFPVQYMVSDNKLVDSKQYRAVNLHSLPSSEFDKYRSMRTEGLTSLELGIPVTDPEVIRVLEAHTIFERNGITVIEKNDKLSRNTARVLSSVYNAMKSKDSYGDQIWERAVAIEAAMFPGSPVQTANILGLCELISIQDANNNRHTVDQLVLKGITVKYDNPKNGSKLHLDIKRKWNSYVSEKAKQGIMVVIPEHVVLAHGMWQLVSYDDKSLVWTEPTFTDQHKNVYSMPTDYVGLSEILW